MAKNCEVCGTKLSFRNSFALEGKLLCWVCLNKLSQEKAAKTEDKSEPNRQEIAEEVIPTLKTTGDDRALTSGGDTEASALMKRYKDAFSVAKITVTMGTLVKVVGVVLSILIIAGGFGLADTARNEVFGIIGLVGGILIGIFLYFLGVLVSAQGQILRASLDSAVNTSPFLSNEQRARAMSLI